MPVSGPSYETQQGEDANRLLAQLCDREPGTFEADVMARGRGHLTVTGVRACDLGGACWDLTWPGGYAYVNPRSVITAKLNAS